VEKEITLGDYGRVLWSGRWIILIAAVGAALIGLVASLARHATYTSSSIIYMGLVTSPKSGSVVPSPITTPTTALKALKADTFIQTAADAAGVPFARVKDGVSFAVERVAGAVGGNLPTVVTVQFTDRNRATAIRVANAYADGVFKYAQSGYGVVTKAEQDIVDHGTTRIAQIEKTLDALRRQSTPVTSVSLVSLQREMATLQQSVDDAALVLATNTLVQQPSIVSKATSASSSAAPGQRLRAVLFGAILGLVLGAIVTFVWRGSPAGRARE
jgi:uncharacterized protein involved in exopolysaccharide biosynthesis